MMELHEQIVKIVEGKGFSLGKVTKQDHVVDDEQYYVEINQSTPEGEDWWETIWFNGTNEGFIDGVKCRYLNFDVDEEVEVWIEGRGKNGVPSSIRALVEDAEWKENKLEKLSDALGELDIDELEEDEEE